jgi:hypothetical protein
MICGMLSLAHPAGLGRIGSFENVVSQISQGRGAMPTSFNASKVALERMQRGSTLHPPSKVPVFQKTTPVTESVKLRALSSSLLPPFHVMIQIEECEV